MNLLILHKRTWPRPWMFYFDGAMNQAGRGIGAAWYRQMTSDDRKTIHKGERRIELFLLISPLRRAIRESKMIYHGCIPKADNAKQLRIRSLKGLHPHHMPCQKLTLEPFPTSNLVKLKKLFPATPNKFPKPHPIRPIGSIKHDDIIFHIVAL
jgi:hypothetical protein